MSLTNTQALMADLAAALNLPDLPLTEDGGVELTVGDDDGAVQMFSQRDSSLLIVAPVGPLPADIGYALALFLLRMNMFNAEMRPFRVAVDEGGGLILWGLLPIAGLSGGRLAEIVGLVADQVAAIRAEAYPPEDGEDDEDDEDDDEDEDEDEDEDLEDEAAEAGAA